MLKASLKFQTDSLYGDMPTSRTEYIFGLNTRSENRNCRGRSDVVPPTNVRYEYGPLRAYIQNHDFRYGFEIDIDARVYTAWRTNRYGSPAWIKPRRMEPLERSGSTMETMRANQPASQPGLDRHGFSIVGRVFGHAEVEHLIDALSSISDESGVRSRGGVYAIRNLLHLSPVIRKLSWSFKVRSIAEEGLHDSALPVRATLFDKTGDANWLVPWHQDLTVCVNARLDVPGYGPWTKKAGVWHVQPPVSVLERMLSVRIHLDDCGERNGALRVIPATHRLGRLTAVQIAEMQRTPDSINCAVEAGGVLIMRPLLGHASSAASEGVHRRVIHIDYASCQLDGGLCWATVSDGDEFD